MRSFYFFDYETFGTDPAMDWPAQFAGIRTDEHLNEIAEPLNIYCRLPDDHLPHPEACLVTGLTPQKVNEQGVTEPEFISQIHREFMMPGTCATGYNSIRFDDEVTRHSLYRNFYDPYAREYKNGNSRWDLIDLTRLTEALRPEGICWPVNEEGHPTFRLEKLTSANGIDHEEAHDAVSDVRATIAWARLLREKQPKVYYFVLKNRGKHQVASLLNFTEQAMVVHVSGMYGAARHNIAVVMPLASHPDNKNAIIVYDLSVDPESLLSLSVERIREQLFTPTEEKKTESVSIPLKNVHINKCPVVAPVNVLRDRDQKRLKIDLSVCARHREQLLASRDLYKKVQAVFSRPEDWKKHDDPELMLYSGGFFSPQDRITMNQLISSAPEQLKSFQGKFHDDRLDELLFRYRGRHYSQFLDKQEEIRWHQHKVRCLLSSDSYQLSIAACRRSIAELNNSAHFDLQNKEKEVLDEITTYIDNVEQSLNGSNV
ncbi:Exodeoxyribonuclease I [invertebrate metagenome]|uniref:Exodeoxyribonuclease I n=1 Tax=invertebrate metagenome TaxID=1711999 RepID=A0A2H9TC47_9ZZZZ